MALVLLSILVLVLLVTLEVKFQSSNFYRRVEMLCNGPQYWPFVGNAFTFIRCNSLTLHPMVMKLCEQYGRFTRFWFGHSVTIVISKHEDVEVLLNSSTEITKSDDYTYLSDWIGTGLLTSTGTKWKTRRKIITPTFHFKILEDFLPVFDSNGDVLVEKLSRKAGKGTFNVYQYINLYALDVVSETALGVQLNSQKDTESKYLRAVRDISSIVFERPFRPWLAKDFIFKFTQSAQVYWKAIKVLHETTEKIIKTRRAALKDTKEELSLRTEGLFDDEIGQKKKLAFLDLLILTDEMSDSDIREEVDTFIFEGHDTVTSALSFVIYALANHPKIQEDVYKEQMKIFGESQRNATVTDLRDMKYLEMVLKEGLRHYPSVPIYGRVLKNDLKLRDGHILPKGCQCYVNVRKLHKDPSVWPNPEEFNPDNFLPDAIRNRSPYAYVPFSAGPRNCIGQRYAMMEMKSCVSKIIRKFKLLPCKDEKQRIQITGQIILVSANGVNIEIEERM